MWDLSGLRWRFLPCRGSAAEGVLARGDLLRASPSAGRAAGSSWESPGGSRGPGGACEGSSPPAPLGSGVRAAVIRRPRASGAARREGFALSPWLACSGGCENPLDVNFLGLSLNEILQTARQPVLHQVMLDEVEIAELACVSMCVGEELLPMRCFTRFSETSLIQQCSSSIQLRLGRAHESSANTTTSLVLPEATGCMGEASAH